MEAPAVSREMAPQVIERVRAFIVRGIRGAVHSAPDDQSATRLAKLALASD